MKENIGNNTYTNENLDHTNEMALVINENLNIDTIDINYELIADTYIGKHKSDFCEILYIIENSNQNKEKIIDMLKILINISNKVNTSDTQLSIKEMLDLKLQEESKKLTKLRNIEMDLKEDEGNPIEIDSIIHLVNSGFDPNSAIRSRGAMSLDDETIDKLDEIKGNHIKELREHMQLKLNCDFNDSDAETHMVDKAGEIDKLKNLTKEQLVKFENYSIFKESEKKEIYLYESVSDYLKSGNSQRSLGIDLSDIDFGIKTRLPLPPIYLKNKTIDLNNSINEILTWTSLLNMPVNTSNLLMLLSGTPMPMIMDSFTILRCYMVFFEIFYQDINTSRKVDKIITYFTNEFEYKRLTREDFKLLLDNIIFKEEDDLKNVLLTNFERLSMKNFLSLNEKIKEIKTFDHKCFENAYFREDLVEEFTARKGELNEQFYIELEEDKLLEFFSCMNHHENMEVIKKKYLKFLEKLEIFTLVYLQTYEIYIMKLLENASNNPCFPETNWTQFISQKNSIHLHLLNEEMVNNSKKIRSELTFIRNGFIYDSGEINGEGQTKPTKKEEFNIDFSDDKIVGLYPNVQDIIDYANFLKYDAKDWESFRLDAINVKTVFENMNKDQLECENTEEESTGMDF